MQNTGRDEARPSRIAASTYFIAVSIRLPLWAVTRTPNPLAQLGPPTWPSRSTHYHTVGGPTCASRSTDRAKSVHRVGQVGPPSRLSRSTEFDPSHGCRLELIREAIAKHRPRPRLGSRPHWGRKQGRRSGRPAPLILSFTIPLFHQEPRFPIDFREREMI